jgi:taurine transport system ATP-binding protein
MSRHSPAAEPAVFSTTVIDAVVAPPRARAPGRVAVRALSHRYESRSGALLALADIDIEIAPGEFVCLVGPSGCGKTTLLRMLAGFQLPSSGTVTVDDEPVRRPGADRGVVFQQPTLFPWLSVRGNVELGPRLQGKARSERRAVAEHMLGLVGLLDVADRPPYELSGGMQQRCSIARVLANDPAIVLMDEPFGALDALTRERMQQELTRIWSATGKTVVFITHSVEEAVFLGTRVIVLSPRPGRIVLDERVEVPAVGAGEDVRLTPEFAAVRARVARHIRGG